MSYDYLNNKNMYNSYCNPWMQYPSNAVPFYDFGNNLAYPYYINPTTFTTSDSNNQTGSKTNQTDTVAFKSAQSEIKDKQENKKGSKAGWIIATSVTIAAIAGGIYLYKRGGGGDGKGVIDAIKDGWKDVFKKAPKEPPKTPPANPEVAEGAKNAAKKEKIEIERVATSIPSEAPQVKLKQYSSLEDAVKDYQKAIQSGDYDTCKNIDEFLGQLKAHNYGNDKSYVEICTRSRNIDFERKVLDVENSTVSRWRITPYHGFSTNVQPEIKPPDMEGSYLITTLSDGRKFVGISVPSGRSDGPKGDCRPIRTMINIVSKDKEYTPLQKDLIAIISQRKNIEFNNQADIMSIGILPSKSADYFLSRNADPYEINKEIFLSSIKTARSQLKPEQLDKDFITRALNGETLEHVEFG